MSENFVTSQGILSLKLILCFRGDILLAFEIGSTQVPEAMFHLKNQCYFDLDFS